MNDPALLSLPCSTATASQASCRRGAEGLAMQEDRPAPAHMAMKVALSRSRAGRPNETLESPSVVARPLLRHQRTISRHCRAPSGLEDTDRARMSTITRRRGIPRESACSSSFSTMAIRSEARTGSFVPCRGSRMKGAPKSRQTGPSSSMRPASPLMELTRKEPGQ